jgi:divalent metal cation (Fe/Co/Zn/Cd) transporter
VGKTRLETVGVILCAVIMSLSATEVIQSSVQALYDGFAKGKQ